MKCEVHGCVADYIPGGRRHHHEFRELGGFRIGDEVEHIDGRTLGTVSRLERTGFNVEVHTRLPGQIVASRWTATQVRHPGAAA